MIRDWFDVRSMLKVGIGEVAGGSGRGMTIVGYWSIKKLKAAAITAYKPCVT
jgi:hypothetical protein